MAIERERVDPRCSYRTEYGRLVGPLRKNITAGVYIWAAHVKGIPTEVTWNEFGLFNVDGPSSLDLVRISDQNAVEAREASPPRNPQHDDLLDRLGTIPSTMWSPDDCMTLYEIAKRGR